MIRPGLIRPPELIHWCCKSGIIVIIGVVRASGVIVSMILGVLAFGSPMYVIVCGVLLAERNHWKFVVHSLGVFYQMVCVLYPSIYISK